MFPRVKVYTQVELNLTMCMYSMVGCNIEQTNEERDLGILIDNQLKFHNHSSTAISKARRLLGLISKIFH